MKYFVMAGTVPLLLYPQRDAVTNYFKTNNYGYWHWLNDFWILQSPYDGDTAESLLGRVKQIAPAMNVVILTVEPAAGWACYGNPQWGDWLAQFWKQRYP
jgi:hypothetical protein